MKKFNLLLALFLPLYLQAQAPTFQIENNALVLPSVIVFETSTDVIKPESFPTLQYVVDYLNAKSYISLMRIEGHTHSGGDESNNQKLSEKRALAVCKWLVAHGIDCKRLLPVGFGSNKPIESNATLEGKAKNARCMFVNAALRGRAIGGMPEDGGGLVAGDACK